MIDSHCHLADEAFEADLDEVVARALEVGLDGALCILDLTNAAETARAARVTTAWSDVGFATGIHPHQAGKFAERLDAIESVVRDALAATPGCRAIGEIGLDYHYDFAPKALQQEVFRRQVRLARDSSYPVVIHTREADDDTLRILEEEGGGHVRGVFHCFTGDAVFARRALDLGFHVSFSGIATFPRAESIREAAAIVPADRLLIETDSPYLAPPPHRGKRNEPAWVTRVAEVLAEVREEPVASLVAATDRAFGTLFDSAAKRLLR